MAPAAGVTILRQDIQEEHCAAAHITDVTPLASYNWVEAKTPTIIVPGAPARWSPPIMSRRLPKDSGLVYIAQNAARHPDSPLEPLFRALYISQPDFDVSSVDVVTDRNNVRKLLSFIDPTSSRNAAERFVINVEITDKTAIFSRAETKTTEYIGSHEFRGFGHEFEKAYTASRINGSTGHHRILSYLLGDLRFLVRHEVDGYLEHQTTLSRSTHNGNEAGDLESLLGSLSLSRTNGSAEAVRIRGSKLSFREEGRMVPIGSTLEIKTRVFHKPLAFSEVAPQLWVSQTPKLVRAYHKGGLFQEAKVEDVTLLIRSWEDENQASLKRLTVLIKKIISSTEECGGRATVVFDVAADRLLVTPADGNPMLPQDLYCKWDNSKVSDVAPETG